MQTEKLVLAALKNKAPSLHRQLAESGQLNQFLTERADQIREAVTSLGQQIAEQQGYSKTLKTDPMKAVGIHNMADAMAREAVHAQLLEFPPAETSPSRPDATTPSDQATAQAPKSRHQRKACAMRAFSFPAF